MKAENLLPPPSQKHDYIVKLEIFATAMLQVTLVALNVICISKGYILFMLCTSFFLSLTWTFNVKKVAFGGLWDRIIYASGAMCGTGAGFVLSKLLPNLTHLQNVLNKN